MNRDLLRQVLEKKSTIEYSRSSGPGGQNVNKVNTKARLWIALEDLEGLSEAERERIAVLLKSRISDGRLMFSCDEERTQEANRRKLLVRAENLIAKAAYISKKRVPTKPSRAAKEARIKSKKLHGAVKQQRTWSGREE